MTPLQLFLVLIIIIIFCYIAENKTTYFNREVIPIIGGTAVLLVLLDGIWAVFYYVLL